MKNKKLLSAAQQPGFLSKKRKKHLEQIVRRNEKKKEHASLIEALGQVNQNVKSCNSGSIQQYQSHGIKKLLKGDLHFANKNYSSKVKSGVDLNNSKNACRAAVYERKSNLQQRRIDELGTGSVLGFSEGDDDGEESSSGDDDSDNMPAEMNENIEVGNAKPVSDLLLKTPIDSPKIVVIQSPIQNENHTVDCDDSDVEIGEVSESDLSNQPWNRHLVEVSRTVDMEAQREKLPITSEEHTVMERVKANPIVMIVGETGCGKTTQVPQFLFEAGFTHYSGKGGEEKKTAFMIGITEPRRVAAITMASRVKHELNIPPNQKVVGHQIKLDSTVDESTEIKFMTEGILLKEMSSDFLLSKYSVIVMDEVHERSVFTDILVGNLTRIVWLRSLQKSLLTLPPLKLVIMSATLQVQNFLDSPNLFSKTGTPPVIHISGRQFETIHHFEKKTPDSYFDLTVSKVRRINSTLPDGGILVFLTGEKEVISFIKLLKCEEKSKRESVDCKKLWLLPLYSALSKFEQEKAFQSPPDNNTYRLCVVATNIAETSLTIPGIKYVVDCGKEKVKVYNEQTGVSSFEIKWISKASANQRAGRAGRVGPGHSYRLYSSQVMSDQFPEFSPPEIVTRPIDDLVLQMKSMGMDNVVNFPFPLPRPSASQLRASEDRLFKLGALKEEGRPNKSSKTYTITELGDTLSKLPLLPRFAKMIVSAFRRANHRQKLLPYTIALVSALSVPNIWNTSCDMEVTELRRRVKHHWASTANSKYLGDLYPMLAAVCAAPSIFEDTEDESAIHGDISGLKEYCQKYALNVKSMGEVTEIRYKLSLDVSKHLSEEEGWKGMKDDLVRYCVERGSLPPPNSDDCRLLCQVLLSGCGDKIGRRVKPCDVKESLIEHISNQQRKVMYEVDPRGASPCIAILDHESVLFNRSHAQLPEFIIFQDVFSVTEETTESPKRDKCFLRGVSCVENEWIYPSFPHLCRVSAVNNSTVEEKMGCSDQGELTVQCDVYLGKWFSNKIDHPYSSIQTSTHNVNLASLHFVKFLLKGCVIKDFAQFSNSYTPSVQTFVDKEKVDLSCNNSEINTLTKLITTLNIRSREEFKDGIISNIKNSSTFKNIFCTLLIPHPSLRKRFLSIYNELNKKPS